MVWFRLNIGRERNADPRWLLPLICKAGDVTKAEIGAIKIFDRDTRFQIVAEHADNFANAVRLNKSKQGHISRLGEVSDASPPTEPANRPSPQAPHDKPRPHGGGAPQKHFGAKPWRNKHEGDAKGGPRPHGAAKPGRHTEDPARPTSKYAHKKYKKKHGPQSAQG
jgi:ATP-dependent RNA helicase DeaD